MLWFAMSSKIETISTLQHLYIIEVLMHVKAQQSCSSTIDVHFKVENQIKPE